MSLESEVPSEPRYSVAIDRTPTDVTVSVIGEVDISNAGTLQERLMEAGSPEAAAVVVDLTKTEYLDSAGIRTLFTVLDLLRDRGTALHLVVPESAVIRRVIALTALDEACPTWSNTAEAVEAAMNPT